MNNAITVSPVECLSQRRQFIDCLHTIYSDDPYWIPPLTLERHLHFSRFNPFFKHGKWKTWLAYSDGRPVGRISAQVDRLHRGHYGIKSGHFGLFEAIEDEVVAAALFQAAESWLRSEGTEVITGPFNLSINQESGLLVDGFDTPPVLMMPHGRRWYDSMVRSQGYTVARDLYAYWITADQFKNPPAVLTLQRRYGSKVKLRPFNRRRFQQELMIIRDIFNDGWTDNWGHVPMTIAEINDLGAALRFFIPDDLICIAEIDDKPVAFMVFMPNLNESFAKTQGSLFPRGIFTLIGDIRKKRIKTGRVPLMGVRKQYHNSPLGIALAFMVVNAVVKFASTQLGMEGAEISWILEDNKGMMNMLDSIGSQRYKTYRVYEKRLSA